MLLFVVAVLDEEPLTLLLVALPPLTPPLPVPTVTTASEKTATTAAMPSKIPLIKLTMLTS